jgi:hypothetical protein
LAKVALAKVGGREAERGRRRETADRLEAAIAALGNSDIEHLRLQWRNHLGGLAPAHLPRWLLLRLLAYRIQAAALGDLDGSLLRLLRQSRGDRAQDSDGRSFAARAPVTREGVGLQPGALLAREWKGRLERVMVLDEGFAWNGATYRSLSQIARAMTGTSWNGHRFFGLRRSDDQRAAPPTKGGRRPATGEGGPVREAAKGGS